MNNSKQSYISERGLQEHVAKIHNLKRRLKDDSYLSSSLNVSETRIKTENNQQMEEEEAQELEPATDVKIEVETEVDENHQNGGAMVTIYRSELLELVIKNKWIFT